MTQASEEMTTPAEPNEAERISLVFPGRPEYVALGRLVAGVVGAREALDEESVADLKLVVTEACTCFMYGPKGSQVGQTPDDGAPSFIRVEFDVSPEAWEIRVSDPEHKHRLEGLGSCDPMSEGVLGLTIINALADSAEFTETEAEGSVIRLIKRFPSSAGLDI
jgi:anti-sigma regulatory factor (Ser/Thr protein kinase)